MPEFSAAIEDDSSAGPAKQIAAEFAACGIDPSDEEAVDRVIRELNAARLARHIKES